MYWLWACSDGRVGEKYGGDRISPWRKEEEEVLKEKGKGGGAGTYLANETWLKGRNSL